MKLDDDHRHERVMFVGYLGTGNLGNDVSLDVVVNAFRRHHDTPRMEILSFGPASSTTTGLPITSLSLSRTTALSKVNRTADHVLVKVGDLVSVTRLLLRTRHVIVPGSGTLESGLGGGVWGLPWALAATAVIGRLTRTPMHLVAVGADRPINSRIAFFNRVTTRLAASRSFRDDLSRRAVADLGVDTTDDPVVPDLAFSRRPTDTGIPPQQGSRRIGLAVQAWHGHANDWEAGMSAHHDYVKAIGRIAAGLLDQGCAVTLLIGDQVDATAFEPILQVVSEHGHAPEALGTHASPTFDDLVEVMAAQDVVIGCRYHSLLGAAVAARPVISLGYGPKHLDLMAGLGLAKWTHDISEIDVDEVIRQVNQALDSQDSASQALHREALRRRARIDAYLDAFIAGVIGPEHSITSSEGRR